MFDSAMSTLRNFAETGGWVSKEGGDDDPRLPDTTPLATDINQALGAVPLGDMVLSMMKAVGDAQLQLDMGAAKVAQLMAGLEVEGMVFGHGGKMRIGRVPGEPDSGVDVSLIELGFAPTFYQFDEIELDIKVTMKMRQELLDSRSAREISTSGTSSGLSSFSSLRIGPAGNRLAKAAESFKNLITGADSWKNVLGWGPSAKIALDVSTVKTETSNKYDMGAEGQASVNVVMGPVEPPKALMERISDLMLQQQRKRDAEDIQRAIRTAEAT